MPRLPNRMANKVQSSNLKVQSLKYKAEAARLGFSACGIARAQRVDDDYACAFRQWLSDGKHAGMAYMENYLDKRLNPCELLPGAKSMLVVALNYYPQRRLSESQLQFAYYAYGKDYHDVMRMKLTQLAEALGLDNDAYLIACDTKPVLERYWAWKAGLGWIGKNNNLIIPHEGSFFFLGEIITAAEADTYALPMESRCGSCTRCIDACPTGALDEDTWMDARRCLSYLTIENRGEIPQHYWKAMGNYIYGCDRCQLACPHNRFAQATGVEELMPSQEFLDMATAQWSSLSPDDFRRIFRGSAVKRAKYDGLMRNIRCSQGDTDGGKSSDQME